MLSDSMVVGTFTVNVPTTILSLSMHALLETPLQMLNLCKVLPAPINYYEEFHNRQWPIYYYSIDRLTQLVSASCSIMSTKCTL